jgi:hypothetical protein
MSTYGQPEFEIAALKKKQTAVWDPMAPGTGTPWEDRATNGVIGGFLKTCIASMTHPRRLVAEIRRPETHNDSRAFVIGCGICWGLSAAGHLGYGLWRRSKLPDFIDFNTPVLAIYLVVALVGSVVGIVALWTLYTAIYNRLVQEETRRGVALPEPLIASACAYAFGPSILAVIPVYGPIAALVVMFVVMVIIGGSARLRLRIAASIIDAIFGFLAIAAVGIAGTALAYNANRVAPDAVNVLDQAAKLANEPAIR